MNLSLSLNDRDFAHYLAQLGQRDINIAGTWALNDMGDEIIGHVRDRMKVIFDRPNPFTLNAFHMKKAKPTDLRISLEEKQRPAGRHFLKVQELGGPRPQGGAERAIAAANPDPGQVIYAVLPGEHAKLDAYGNWSAGERNKVMAQLKVGRDMGFTSNETKISGDRRKRRRAARYFIPKHGLAPGVYRRDRPDSFALRVLKFSTKIPKYEARLGFHEEVERLFSQRLPAHLSRTLAKILAKRSKG